MGKRTMKNKGGCMDCGGICGGTKLTEFIEWEKAYDSTRALYPEALESYNAYMALSPEQQQQPEQRARYEATMRFFNTFQEIDREFNKVYKELTKQQQKEYKKKVENEYRLSPEEREALKRGKPKPLRPLPPIPEVEERPSMERQDAVGMGKKITFARKYLRGKGIRATKGNVQKMLNSMDVEGVVFES